ncbi:MAG: hypothetical protein KAH46_20605 [Mycobacterium sp.]|nr:hypothetical protein [Mycobacterium sp.]
MLGDVRRASPPDRMAPAGSPDHTGDRWQITSGGGARTVRNAVVDTPS